MALRYGRRIRRKVSKRVVKSKPRMGNSVRALATRVRALSKRVAGNTANHHLYQDITNIDPLYAPYTYYNLTQWNNMSSIFGTALVDWSASNKLYFKKLSMHVKVEQSLEADNTSISLFLVSLKDNANTTSRFNASTGALALNSAVDYAQLSGRTFLNPRVFTIHRQKRIYFTNGGATLSSTGAGDKNLVVADLKWTIYPKHSVNNGASNVRDMACSQDPSKCYYLLAFNDNLLADLTSPLLTVNAHYAVVGQQ